MGSDEEPTCSPALYLLPGAMRPDPEYLIAFGCFFGRVFFTRTGAHFAENALTRRQDMPVERGIE